MSPSICNYYVDEAGDPVLFDGRGNVLVGRQGCSSFFIPGLAYYTKRNPLTLAAIKEKAGDIGPPSNP